MKRKVISAMLIGATAVSLVACGSSGSSSSSSSDSSTASSGSGSGTIGISMPTKSLERWNRDGAYLQKQFEDAGFDVVLTYSDNDEAKQVSDIQNTLAQDVDLLIVAAINGESLNTAMNEAADADVPVIAYDRLILNDAVSYYVSFDNYTVGKLQGEYIEDALGLKDAADGDSYNLEITAGPTADNNAKYFLDGAMDVLQPYIDAGTLKVPSGQTEFEKVQTDNWNTDTALERAQNILSSYYADGTQLDAWLCSNDATALGIAKALESDYKGKNDVVITGQDGDEANLQNIVDGKQSMTVYKNVSNESIVTLELAKAILAGDTIDESLIDSFGVEATYDTESYETSDGHTCPSFLLVPNVITKDNLEDLVDTGLYEWDGDYLKATN